jgi:SOS response regulatory protein OraA/RecX
MIDEEKKLTNIALKFLSHHPRLSTEIFSRLQKASKDHSLINQIISKLEKSGFINDLQFISDYINFHAKTKLQGPYLIRAKLLNLGANRSDIETITKRVLDQEVLVALVNQLVIKKTKGLSLTLPQKAKLYRFLTSRGFPPEIIKKACLID